MTAALPQPFVFEHGVASLGVGQPTNPTDRSTFIKFNVKIICTVNTDISVRYFDTPIEIDLEGTVGQLAGVLYDRAVWKWPDVRPASMFLRRNLIGFVDMHDLSRPVVDVMPMAYNDEALMCRIYEAPHAEDQD